MCDLAGDESRNGGDIVFIATFGDLGTLSKLIEPLDTDTQPLPDDHLVAVKLGRQNLKDDVATYIRTLVYAGRLHSGAKIDQNAIALELGLSRLPVREALITLESEGIVEIMPRRGEFVAPLTRGDIKDAYDVYGTIAAIGARAAAEAIDEVRLRDLRALVERMREPGLTSDDQSTLNYEFHRIINTTGTSRRLQASLRTLARGIPRWPSAEPSWAAQAIVQHDAIVDALAAHDGDAAATAMHKHLLAGAEFVIERMQQRGFWPSADGQEVSS